MEQIKSTIFLDIDGVLALPSQYCSRKRNAFGVYNFDKKCVNVLNNIIDNTVSEIVLSSDWKLSYNIDAMNNIFKYNGINSYIVHYTPSLWGTKYKDLKELEECRANEILEYVKAHDIKNYVAIDDLDLSPWICEEHFVHCARINEGIKQSNIKEKIITKLKYKND